MTRRLQIFGPPAFGVLLALLLLASLEGAMRALGAGERDPLDTPLKYQRVFLPILEPGRRPNGTAIFRTVDPRLPYQSILREKPARSLRVFTFGGSATAGLGYSPNVTFARYLERMLQAAQPGRLIEVVNLGIVALSSRQVKHLLADVCQRYEPDLLVVYSGNNEFLEIHAQKYVTAHATLLERARDRVAATNLYRLLNRTVHGGPKPTASASSFSKEDLRLTEDEIIRSIGVTPAEVSQVIDEYEANLDHMARTAKQHRTPLLLLAVGSNWKWRGREDLPPNWLTDLTGFEAEDSFGSYESALPILDKTLHDASLTDRHEWLFRRALVHEKLGHFDAARDDYRAAMNADPHLRRALDTMNERVKRVAARNGASFLDTIDELARKAEHGIVGFDEFYDYVHFTPKGALLVAEAIFKVLEHAAMISPSDRFAPEDYVRQQLTEIEALSQDFLDAGTWMGFSFDRQLLHDRDLWKYDKMLDRLDQKLEEDPSNVRALVYRGNGRSFRVDGAAGALEDYRAALALAADMPEVRANMERLMGERAP